MTRILFCFSKKLKTKGKNASSTVQILYCATVVREYMVAYRRNSTISLWKQPTSSPAPSHHHNIIKLAMELQTHQLPLRVQSTTEYYLFATFSPFSGVLLDCRKQPPHEDCMFLYFLSDSFILPLTPVLLPLPPLGVGRDRIRCRCGRGRTDVVGVLYGGTHGRRGCRHVRATAVRDRGHGSSSWPGAT